MKDQNYQELVQEFINHFGSSYKAGQATGISQTQFLKYEKGEAGHDVFTAQMISTLLNNFAKTKVVNAVLQSVKEWEEGQDPSKKGS